MVEQQGGSVNPENKEKEVVKKELANLFIVCTDLKVNFSDLKREYTEGKIINGVVNDDMRIILGLRDHGFLNQDNLGGSLISGRENPFLSFKFNKRKDNPDKNELKLSTTGSAISIVFNGYPEYVKKEILPIIKQKVENFLLSQTW